MCYQAPLKEVNSATKIFRSQVQAKTGTAKSNKPVVKPSQPASGVQIVMVLVAHSLSWNFVKFADYTVIPEYIKVSSAHKCMPMLQTFT